MVSSLSITGAVNSFSEEQIKYFKRINKMNLKSSLLIGFGISNKQTYMDAIKHSNGVIIGSAFINHLKYHGVDKISEIKKKIKD